MALAAPRVRSWSAEGAGRSAVRFRAGDIALSPRNWAILRSLQSHVFLTTDQLRRLHFWDHATETAAARICRHVLRRMSEQQLIEHIGRRIGGIRAGSSSFVWRLGPVGDRLLRQQDGDGVRARRKEPSTYYLDHRLAVAELGVQLREAEHAGALDVITVETEPHSWRRYLASGGGAVLKPDLYAVTASGEYEDSWFIEVDRGTESIPTLIRKCAQYETFRRTGIEQQQADGVFPYVIWQLPNQVRLDKLAAAIRRARSLDARLFRLTTPDTTLRLITSEGVS